MIVRAPRLRSPYTRTAAAALPAVLVTATAGSLTLVGVGWMLALVGAAVVTASADGRYRAVRYVALHAVTLPLVPAVALAAGLRTSMLAIDGGTAATLAAIGLLTVTGATRVTRTRTSPADAIGRRRPLPPAGLPVALGPAVVLALRAAAAAGAGWRTALAAGVVAFALLTMAWRAAVVVDMRRRRPASQQRLLSFWTAIERRLFDRTATRIGHVVEEWGLFVAGLVPVTLAGQARLIVGGVVGVLAYLLWTR